MTTTELNKLITEAKTVNQAIVLRAVLKSSANLYPLTIKRLNTLIEKRR